MKIIRNNTHKTSRRFDQLADGDTFEYGGKLYIRTPCIQGGNNAGQFAVDGMRTACFHPYDLCIPVDVTVSYSYRPKGE